MDAFLSLTVYILATWRLANLFVTEDGPKGMFVRIRKEAQRWQFTADLLGCVWCASIWIGGFWMVADLLIPAIAFKLALIFAFSAGALVIHRWFECKEKDLLPNLKKADPIYKEDIEADLLAARLRSLE